MKKFLLLFVIVGSGLMVAAQSFEGIVTMTPDFKTKPDKKMVFYFKGDQVALEQTEGGPMNGKMVGNRKTKDYYVLIESEGKKIALNINMDQLKGMVPGKDTDATEPAAHPDAHPVKPTIHETGATRMIDGYSARQILTEMDGNKSEMWVTKDVDLSIADMSLGAMSGSQFKDYEGIKGMVLEEWDYDADGKINSSVKMTPEKKPIDDKMFVIPEDYVKMDIMQMIQAAQGDPEMRQEMMEIFGSKK